MDEWLYRGVSARHPAWFAAWMGMAVPGNIHGTVSAIAHNLGNFAADSPFTSWTDLRSVAEFHRDKDGAGGLLLRVPLGGPAAGESWRWEYSPDVYGERERLLRGVRMGIEVVI